RYFTRTFERPTAFWYTECEEYNFDKLSKDTRRNITQGRQRCTVQQIEPQWLAAHGYPCYLSAFARYRNARPDPLDIFQKECIESVGGPFEYWGAFTDCNLIGFM